MNKPGFLLVRGFFVRLNANREVPAPKARPVVKWAGGKRQMIDHCREFFPASYNAYHEPFLGGGAVFFHLIPPVSYLSDLNEELINLITDQPFGARDHERLARTFDRLARRGCLVMLSNSDTPFVRELYSRYERGIIPLTANRPINSMASHSEESNFYAG